MDSKLRFSRVKTAQGRFSTQQRRPAVARRHRGPPISTAAVRVAPRAAQTGRRFRSERVVRSIVVLFVSHRETGRRAQPFAALRSAPRRLRPPFRTSERLRGERAVPSIAPRRAPPHASEPLGQRSGAPGGRSERCPSEARSALPVSTACDRGAARGTPFAAPAADARTQEALQVLAVCRLAVCVCHEPLRPRGHSLRCPLSPSVGLLQTDALYDSRRPSSTRRLLRPRPGT